MERFLRKQNEKAIELLKEGRIDTFVVYKLDRLDRTVKDPISFFEFYDKYEINFVSVTENINLKTTHGIMAQLINSRAKKNNHWRSIFLKVRSHT